MFDGILFTITKIKNCHITHGLGPETLAKDSKGMKKGQRHTYNEVSLTTSTACNLNMFIMYSTEGG